MDVHDVAVRGNRGLDARSYADRLVMIERVERLVPDVTTEVETPWRGSPHAGIELQTRWQRESGRTFPDQEELATGWWAAVNYTLSVWPYLVARKHLAGFDGAEQVVCPDDPRYELESTVEELWLEYLRARQTAEHLWRSHDLSEEAIRTRASRLQSLLWDAHLRSVRVARERFSDRLATLPVAERAFARIWGDTTVEYLAVLNAPTTSRISGYFNRFLPGFVLRGAAIDGPANPLDASQQLMLSRLRALHRYEKRHGYRMLQALRSAAPVLEDAGFFDHSYRALGRAIDSHRADGLAEVLAAFFRNLA